MPEVEFEVGLNDIESDQTTVVLLFTIPYTSTETL